MSSSARRRRAGLNLELRLGLGVRGYTGVLTLTRESIMTRSLHKVLIWVLIGVEIGVLIGVEIRVMDVTAGGACWRIYGHTHRLRHLSWRGALVRSMQRWELG